MVKVVLFSLVCVALLVMVAFGYWLKKQQKNKSELAGIVVGITAAMVSIGIFNYFTVTMP
ncbi:MAG: hypothetical protein IJ184_02940 [Alphaproteobacteria bacterium]|nr:hypothetical protein [Alphaproteobacteria bacterium]